MFGRADWMIYGANGYTGHLVAAEARRRDLNPVLAGRRAGPIGKLAAELGLSMRVFDLDDPPAAAAAIAGTAVVANCAGPFAATSAPMIDACLTSRVHYLDITGEIDVFLAAQRRHADARAAGIVICPGVGFDVIPTDCMAAVLKEALPDATHLVLAFDARGPMSPGTARTMARSLRLGQHGGRVRRNGVIDEAPLAQSWRRIDFAGGCQERTPREGERLLTLQNHICEFESSVSAIDLRRAALARRSGAVATCIGMLHWWHSPSGLEC